MLSKSEQVLFTTTDVNLFAHEFTDTAEIWKVQDGTVLEG